MQSLTQLPPTPIVDDKQLARILERHRFLQRLTDVCNLTRLRLAIVGHDGHVVLECGDALAAFPEAPHEVRLAVRIDGHPIAHVRATGSQSSARQTASLVAGWLEDLLRLEAEVGSLTHEVVRSYEELHVLYGLGERLGGVLEVEEACRLIVQAVLAPLGAAHAALSLRRHGVEEVVARAMSPDPGTTAYTSRARATAILHVNGEPIGSLVVQGKLDEQEFTSGDLKLLEGVVAVSSPAIHNAQLYEVARQQADTDSLTGILNHRRIHERIEEEIERARCYRHPFAIVLVDVDGFKLFNDVYGHPVGDRVLQLVAEALRASVRVTDFVGRYGGDEFMLMLPETDAAGAMEVGRRVLSDVGGRELIVNGSRLPIALSLGIACFPHDSGNKHELIAHADTALYESKGSGGRTIRHTHASRKDWLDAQGNTFNVLEGLVQAVDAKDHYTREHSEVVTDAALLLARRLNLSDETHRALRIAGLLHDVGKIGIPDHVLKKPGKLTVEEYEVMKQHVVLSEMIIKGVPQLNDVLDAVAHHHERYDGKGYPYGKGLDEIPLLGRIMAVADAYSAMCMDRPYRKGMSWPDVRVELQYGAGSQFDPVLVELFIAAMDETTEAALANHDALGLVV